MKQNIYDNPTFFKSYMDLRDNDKGLNEEIETPTLRALISDINSKVVLDLGCGLGHQIKYLLDNNVKEVTGVDISDRMLTEARKRIKSDIVTFICEPIEDYIIKKQKYDVILSSMTLHYIKDLLPLFKKIYEGLKRDGQFIFSIEHPICTSLLKGWINTQEGDIWPVANYSQESVRHQDWFVKGVKKYHRKISSIINLLISLGFKIEKIEEPEPDKDTLNRRPDLAMHIERPPILIIKAVK